MKRLFLTLFITLFGFSTFGAEKRITIRVHGIVCSFCAQGLKKKFKNQPEIENVAVSLEKKEVSLTLKEGKTLEDKAIEKIVQEAGYTVDKIERAAK